MASIVTKHRRDGTRYYLVRWRDRAGQQSKAQPTYAAARALQAQVEASKLDGSYRSPKVGRTALADVFEAWLLSRRVDVRPSTWALYESIGTRFIAADPLGAQSIGDITRADVRAWVAALAADGVGRRTIEVARQVLHGVFVRALEDGLVNANPAVGVRTPRDDRPSQGRRLTPAEVEAIAGAIEPQRPYRALVLLGGYAGLRIGEALGLRWRNVDLLQRRIAVVEQLVEHRGTLALAALKTKASRRVVTLPAFLSDELAALHPGGDAEYVFTTASGGLVRRSNFRGRTWARALERAGVPTARFHDLRHHAASIAVANGAHPKQVQARLGHSSIAVTMDVYADLFDGIDDDLAVRIDESRGGGDVRALRRSS
jgi:integrase